MPLVLFASACTHGPERMEVSLDNAVAKPGSHQFAFSVKYTRLREPTGINTFPNGGVPKVLYREARVYLCDLDRGTVDLVAKVPGFAGIPQPKAVWVEGWRDEALYFSLRGYGAGRRGGDDRSDPRKLLYRVATLGEPVRLERLPENLESARNTGPVGDPPFLRLSRGHLDVEIAVDEPFSEATDRAILAFEAETGDPVLSVP